MNFPAQVDNGEGASKPLFRSYRNWVNFTELLEKAFPMFTAMLAVPTLEKDAGARVEETLALYRLYRRLREKLKGAAIWRTKLTKIWRMDRPSF
ncbi:hypothetical protein Zmor_012410 [Zophobas morio]|uniref:Uncharacterized protein n=1 Tax=Zophobas morio TaxID=2755281 RepID=A0AA38HG25_9CUCU|nr:hypothetical protein Zmor_012410 [Zophobas morio]